MQKHKNKTSDSPKPIMSMPAMVAMTAVFEDFRGPWLGVWWLVVWSVTSAAKTGSFTVFMI